jgi:hypothetical protein
MADKNNDLNLEKRIFYIDNSKSLGRPKEKKEEEEFFTKIPSEFTDLFD